jgi:hypothetical protein
VSERERERKREKERMCTIIKVKRKLTEDPAECLVIECKKKKKTYEIDTNESSELTHTKSQSVDETTNKNKTISNEPIKQILKYAYSTTNEVSSFFRDFRITLYIHCSMKKRSSVNFFYCCRKIYRANCLS